MNLEERKRELRAIAVKILPDGREVSIVPMIFNHRMCIGEPDAMTFDDAYCFASEDTAMASFDAWNGEGEPDGWIKHIGTQRFRPDGDPAREFVQH